MQKCLLKEGEMIVVRSGVNTGDCATVPKSLAGSYGAYDLIVRFSNDVIPSFISTFLDTNIGRLQLNLLKGRSAQSHLNAEEISSIIIPKPPIEVQKSLVAEIEVARQNRKQKLAQAEKLLSSIDSYLLNELGLTLPEKSKNKVYAISTKQIEYSRIDPFFYTPSLLKSEAIIKSFKPKVVSLSSLLSSPILNGIDARKYQENGQRYLRVQNIKPFEIILDDVKCVSVTSSKDVSLASGDVLLTRKGTFGVATIVSEEAQDCLISSEIMLLRMAENSECRADYLVAWLNSSIAKTILERHKTGGIMGHLTQDIVSQFPIPIPSDDIQQKIIQEIYHKRQTATKIRQEAELEWETAKTRFEQKLLGEET